MIARLVRVTGDLVAAGEPAMGAGLLVQVTELAGQGEGVGAPRTGLAGVFGREQDVTEAVEYLGLAGSLADLA